MTWQTQLLLGNPLKLSFFTAFVFFSTFLLYAVHRLVSLQKLKYTHPQARFKPIASLRHFYWGAVIVLLFLVIYLFFKLPRPLQIALFLPILLSAGYALPLLPGQKRLRDIHFIKNVLIAGVWTWVTVLLPVFEMQLIVNQEIVWMCIGRFSFVFAISLAFDVRDVVLDRATQVKTIPIAGGIALAKKTAMVFLFITFICVVLNWLLGFYKFGGAAGIITSLIITSLLIMKATPEKEDFYFACLLDGVMILQFLLVWLLNN